MTKLIIAQLTTGILWALLIATMPACVHVPVNPTTIASCDTDSDCCDKNPKDCQ